MKKRANGQGSIYHRNDGRWVGCLIIGIDFKGKYIRKYVYGKNYEDVEKKLKKVKKENNTNRNLKLKEWLEIWIEAYLEEQKEVEDMMNSVEEAYNKLNT